MDDATQREGGDEPKREKLPGLVPLFQSNAQGTLSAIGVTCAVVGVVSMVLELLMAREVGATPGELAGFGAIFISAPLGLGALMIGVLQLWSAPRFAIFPLASGTLYWALHILLMRG
jgi:hypothetical protein